MSQIGSMRSSFAKHLGLIVLITRVDKFPLVEGHFSYPHFTSQVNKSSFWSKETLFFSWSGRIAVIFKYAGDGQNN